MSGRLRFVGISSLTNLQSPLSRLRERVRERADLATVAPAVLPTGTSSAEIRQTVSGVGSRKARPLPDPLPQTAEGVRRNERSPPIRRNLVSHELSESPLPSAGEG